jgi:hypothetical protein
VSSCVSARRDVISFSSAMPTWAIVGRRTNRARGRPIREEWDHVAQCLVEETQRYVVRATLR